MTQHLTDFRERMNNIHGQITQAYQIALNDPAAAQASFIYLQIQIGELEREHNAWTNAYLVRAAFGPNSPQEQQAAGMSSGVTRWIAQDVIYVLLGISTAALAGSRVDDAHQAADEALKRCNALGQQGMTSSCPISEFWLGAR